MIATSARLNGGQERRSTKSVTAPARTRSARLPSAPPASSPTATHIPGRVGLRAKRKPTKPSARRRRHQRRAAAAGEPEGDALVVGEGEPERPEHVDLLAGDQLASTIALAAWSRTRTRRAERPREPPGAVRAALTRRSGRRPPPGTTKRTMIADHRAEVEREAAAADRGQETAEEVEVGIGGLGDEVEHRPQPGL